MSTCSTPAVQLEVLHIDEELKVLIVDCGQVLKFAGTLNSCQLIVTLLTAVAVWGDQDLYQIMAQLVLDRHLVVHTQA